MSSISYFQRYSQKENHATNNVMLVLRHFYSESPKKFGEIINEIIGSQVSIGLEFKQQIRGARSVPDAQISQKPFELFVETKLDGMLDPNQIERHIKSIKCQFGEDETGNIYLLGLTKKEISSTQANDLTAEAKKSGIVFCATTFTQLLKVLDDSVQNYEGALQEIVDDFGAYLDSSGLIDYKLRLLIRPTRATMVENVKYGFYCEPVEQPDRSHANYFGLYENKTVRFIGKIERVFVGQFVDGIFVPDSKTKDKFEDSDRDIIAKAASEVPFYSGLKRGMHRYYFVDGFKKTSLKKSSPRGIWRAKYLQLRSLLPEDGTADELATSEIAEALCGRSFE